MHEGPDFIVINKPAGIPVHASVDNLQDNVLYQLRARFRTLLVTQRLDVPVAGLMVIAKNEDFQRRFNQWLSDGKVEKRYRAQVAQKPARGLQVHYMEPSERSPKKLSATEIPKWLRCELTIHAIEERSDGHFELEIELHTGRTHQIRAQLAFLGAPIIGDRQYGSRLSAAGVPGSIALFSAWVAWTDKNGKRQEFCLAAPC